MSKPLGLTIYPRPIMKVHARGPAPYVDMVDGGLVSEQAANMLAGAKRLTDAELAAEYWRAEGGSLIVAEYSALDGWFNDDGAEYLSWDATDHWRQTVARFATTPHYFEADQ